MRTIKMVLTGMVAAVAVLSAQADLLIGWDSAAGTNYSFVANGILGNLYTSVAKTKTDGTSTDGTFGSEFSGAETGMIWSAAVAAVADVNNRLGIRIENNTGYDVVLDKIHFDAGRAWAGSPDTLTMVYRYGDLNVAQDTVVNSVTGLPQLQGAGNPGLVSAGYANFDWSLTGMEDYTLAPGEEAVFWLLGSNSSGTADTYIDNIGISGTVMIPEPATIGMLGLGALVAMVMRRSRRS